MTPSFFIITGVIFFLVIALVFERLRENRRRLDELERQVALLRRQASGLLPYAATPPQPAATPQAVPEPPAPETGAPTSERDPDEIVIMQPSGPLAWISHTPDIAPRSKPEDTFPLPGARPPEPPPVPPPAPQPPPAPRVSPPAPPYPRPQAAAKRVPPPVREGPSPAKVAFQKIRAKVERNITSHIFTWLGGVAFMFAGFFLVKYSIEQGLVTPAMRVASAGVLAAALVGTAEFFFRRKQGKHIAGILAGAGMAIAYCDCYAAAMYYEIVPVAAAFIGAVCCTAATVAMSFRYGERLSILAIFGGFITPGVINTGSGNTILLFSYLGILTIGMLWLFDAKKRMGAAALVLAFNVLWIFGWHFTHMNVSANIIYLLAYLTVFAASFAAFGIRARVWHKGHTACFAFFPPLLALALALGHAVIWKTAPEAPIIFWGAMAFCAALYGFGLKEGPLAKPPYWVAYACLLTGFSYLRWEAPSYLNATLVLGIPALATVGMVAWKPTRPHYATALACLLGGLSLYLIPQAALAYDHAAQGGPMLCVLASGLIAVALCAWARAKADGNAPTNTAAILMWTSMALLLAYAVCFEQMVFKPVAFALLTLFGIFFGGKWKEKTLISYGILGACLTACMALYRAPELIGLLRSHIAPWHTQTGARELLHFALSWMATTPLLYLSGRLLEKSVQGKTYRLFSAFPMVAALTMIALLFSWLPFLGFLKPAVFSLLALLAALYGESGDAKKSRAALGICAMILAAFALQRLPEFFHMLVNGLPKTGIKTLWDIDALRLGLSWAAAVPLLMFALKKALGRQTHLYSWLSGSAPGIALLTSLALLFTWAPGADFLKPAVFASLIVAAALLRKKIGPRQATLCLVGSLGVLAVFAAQRFPTFVDVLFRGFHISPEPFTRAANTLAMPLCLSWAAAALMLLFFAGRVPEKGTKFRAAVHAAAAPFAWLCALTLFLKWLPSLFVFHPLIFSAAALAAFLYAIRKQEKPLLCHGLLFLAVVALFAYPRLSEFWDLLFVKIPSAPESPRYSRGFLWLSLAWAASVPLLFFPLKRMKAWAGEIFAAPASAIASISLLTAAALIFSWACSACSLQSYYTMLAAAPLGILACGLLLSLRGESQNNQAMTFMGYAALAFAAVRYFPVEIIHTFPATHLIYVAGSFPLNALLVSFLLPALAFTLLARFSRQKIVKTIAGALALCGFFLLLNVELRFAFQGHFMNARAGDGEFYAYSMLWLFYGIALLFLGYWKNQKALRWASLAFVLVAVGKVFLFDASKLEGLLRVLSFALLGACLIGIGYFYARVVFKTDRK